MQILKRRVVVKRRCQWLLTGVFVAVGSLVVAAEPPPNIIVVMADDVGYEALGVSVSYTHLTLPTKA